MNHLFAMSLRGVDQPWVRCMGSHYLYYKADCSYILCKVVQSKQLSLKSTPGFINKTQWNKKDRGLILYTHIHRYTHGQMLPHIWYHFKWLYFCPTLFQPSQPPCCSMYTFLMALPLTFFLRCSSPGSYMAHSLTFFMALLKYYLIFMVFPDYFTVWVNTWHTLCKYT